MIQRSVAVIVPVRNGGTLLNPCLASLVPEVRSNGGSLVVVDDNSSDHTAALATDAGAEVVSLPDAGGPYRARNIGWRSTTADVLVFTDVRCRATSGWLHSLLVAIDDPAVAIAAGVCIVPPGGKTWADRVMHQMQPLDSRKGAHHPFLPWAPTACMAVRREVLQVLDGFLEVRSGGDVDFCWRAQLLTGGRLAVADEARMEWEPRPSMAACVGQWYRYGRHHPALYKRFEAHGASLPIGRGGPAGAIAHEIKLLGRAVARHGIRGLDIDGGVAALRVAEATGRWVGRRRSRRSGLGG